MKIAIFWLDSGFHGRLGISARPRGGDWLEDEVKGWRAGGVQSVVSLLTPSEEQECDLADEKRACEKHGVAFHSFAIPDRGVPSSRASLKRLAFAVLDDLKRGRNVVVHCRQGIGRSALVVASVLVQSGEDADKAFLRIGQARGRPVPDTDEQVDWVRRLAGSLRREVSSVRPLHRRTVAAKAHA